MVFAFNNELDQTFLQSLYGDDLEYAQEVFEGFLSETKKEFEAIKNDYGQNDVKKIRQKLHKIKPTFSFVGLTALTERTEMIIAACDAASNTGEIEPGCSALFKEIEASFLLVENELMRMKDHTV
ncbi:MAG TPA: Hpt domain-containing protein [Chitinophagaceae bacterium]